jgi:Ser/Thr protein kinase RdoA (MazF antagonist)
MSSDFYSIHPDSIMRAVEIAGLHPTGEFMQLNSYENRVFDIQLEKDPSAKNPMSRVIAKFYRPERWTRDCILEEHSFLKELQLEGLPVVAPLKLKNNSTLEQVNSVWVSLFPKFMGRMPEELLPNDFASVGRTLARMHNIGSQKSFRHRPEMNASPYSGWDNLELLQQWVRPEIWPQYERDAISILQRLEDFLETASFIRVHGDAHRGNLLFRDEFFFVDFDDCMMGPAIQDLWMLLQSADANELETFINGYEELREFPENEWENRSLLQGLRIISYSAWIARRWTDPSFPRLFPDFESYQFWAEESEALMKIARE